MDQLPLQDPNYITIVTKRFNVARTNQIAWFEKFSRWYGLYRNYQYRKNYQGRSNLFVPVSFWTVESFVPRLFRSLRKIIATPRPKVDTDPKVMEKMEANSKAATSLFEYQRQKMGWDNILRSWIRGTGIYGSYPVKVTWDFENDQPCVDLVDIMDLFVDPQADKMENARWVIHRTVKHYDELRTSKIKYKNLDKIMPKGTATDDEGFKKQRKAILSVAQRPYDSTSKLVDIYEMWGWVQDPNNPDAPDKNMLITVANKNTVIRAEENPMADLLQGNALPFVNMYDTDTPHEYYGMGEIEPIEPLQEELNDTRNQRMDNVTLVLNRMWEVVRSADVSDEDFVSLPGKVFYSNVPGGIKPLETPDVTESATNEEKLIKEDIQQTTTGTANVDIPAINRSETATGILAIQEAGDTRTEYKVMNMKEAIQKVWTIILALNQELIDKDFIVKLEGQQGISFQKHSPKDIKGEFDITVEVESQQNRLVKKQEAMQLYQLALKTPNANIPKAYKDVLDLFDKSNPDEYLLPPPPPQPPEPSVSISLRGELTPDEVDEFAQRAGANPKATDPLLRPEHRLNLKAMAGNKEPLLPDEQKIMAEIGAIGAKSQNPAQEKGKVAPIVEPQSQGTNNPVEIQPTAVKSGRG